MSEHRCHARGCIVALPPKMFMCRKHWFMLPKAMRDAVWAEHRPGQRIGKDPTAAYLRVTRICIECIAEGPGVDCEAHALAWDVSHGDSEDP